MTGAEAWVATGTRMHGTLLLHMPPLGATQLAFNSTAINFRIAKFRLAQTRSDLGPMFALKMGPKFAQMDIFQNKMGRGYLPE